MSSNNSPYDVVIVGAGISGALLANKLGQAGARVVIIEAGDEMYFDRETGIDQRQPLIDRFIDATAKVPNAPYPNLDYAPSPQENALHAYYTGPAYDDPGRAPATATGDAVQQHPVPAKFQSTYTRIVGGTTYHWLGTSLRYVPNTFREKTVYGIGADWPITYDELEPWYGRAEHEIGVAGDSEQDLGAPRSQPYPMPPITQSYSDRRIAARIGGLTYDGLPVLVQPTPQARNSVPFEDRPPCAGSVNCIPICPIQAKYDATVHLKRALDPRLDPRRRESSRPVELRLGAVVTRVLVEDGKVSGIEYKERVTKETDTVTGTIYILAAHAIEIPKILLCSSDRGVANSSDCVGRYLMDHDIKIGYASADEPLYPFRGPISTSGIESLRDGPFRRQRAAFRVQIDNVGTNWGTGSPFTTLNTLLGKNLIGASLRNALAWQVSRQIELDALLEPEPSWHSTVTPSKQLDDFGIPRPRLTYQVSEYTQRGAQAFEEVATMVFKRMGARDQDIVFPAGYYGAGHVMGTHRMGTDAATSVCDSYGRTHDHPNLFLTGSGLFPTVGTANPTLTIVALTLRTAALLERELGL